MTKYLDPRKDPHRWLRAMLEHLVDLTLDGDKEAAQVCKSSFQSLILRVEKGFIEDQYSQWIWEYTDLLEKYQNNQNMDHLLLKHKDSQESSE